MLCKTYIITASTYNKYLIDCYNIYIIYFATFFIVACSVLYFADTDQLGATASSSTSSLSNLSTIVTINILISHIK